MRISIKLTIAFLGVALLVLVVGYFAVVQSQRMVQENINEHLLMLAEETMEKIDRVIAYRVETIQEYAHSSLVAKTVTRSNELFARMDDSQGYMLEQDQLWRQSSPDEITPFMRELFDNELSKSLQESIAFYQEHYGYRVYGEVFVTNRYGANVAQSEKTTDFYQADETWWQRAREEGFFVGKVSYDESAQMYAVDIAVAVYERSGEFAGVIKAVLNIADIIEIAKESDSRAAHARQKKTPYVMSEITLIDPDGGLIYPAEGDYAYTSRLVAVVKELDRGVTQGVFPLDGDDIPYGGLIVGYAYSQGYRTVKDLGWVVAVAYSKKEVFRPIKELRDVILLIASVAALLAIILGLRVSQSIVIPLRKLKILVEAIGKGQFGRNDDIQATGEMGDLAKSFMDMRDALSSSRAAIVQAKEELERSAVQLEQRVQDRTKELLDTQGAILNMMEDLEEVKEIVLADKIKMESMIESVPQGLVMLDEEGVCSVINPSARNILGFASGETIDSNALVRKFQAHGVDKLLAQYYQKRDFVAGEVVVAQRTFQCTISSVESESSHGLGAVVVLKDVTAEKEIDRLKDEFLSAVSHELKTPLTSLLQAAELLLSKEIGELTPTQREFVSIIDRDVKRFARLVRDLLDISRFQLRQFSVNRRANDFARVVRDVLRAFRAQAQAQEVSLRVSLPDGLPLVFVDSERIQQVLVNLVSNALKFTHEGMITIRARQGRRSLRRGESLAVTIKLDSGEEIAGHTIDTSAHGVCLQLGVQLAVGVKGSVLIHYPDEIVSAYGKVVWEKALENVARPTWQVGFEFLEPDQEGAQPREIVVCVADTGLGFSPEDASKLFKRFQQFHRKPGPGYKGVGLGLSIAKDIVEMHQGTIWAQSQLDQGSNFYFTIPVFDYRLHIPDCFNELQAARAQDEKIVVVRIVAEQLKSLSPEMIDAVGIQLAERLRFSQKQEVLVCPRRELSDIVLLSRVQESKLAGFAEQIKSVISHCNITIEGEAVLDNSVLHSVFFPDEGQTFDELIEKT